MDERKPFIHAMLAAFPKLRVAGSNPVPRSQKSPGQPLDACRSAVCIHQVGRYRRPFFGVYEREIRSTRKRANTYVDGMAIAIRLRG